MHTVKFLTFLVGHHQAAAYALIFLGLIFEGEVTVITTGVLVNLKALSLWHSLAIVLLGGLCKSLFGYYLGMVIRKRWSHVKFFQFFEKRVRYLVPQFKEKPFWSIFISKFIMTANVVVVLFSGFERVDFKKYLKAEICASLIWGPGLIAMGYFFSYTALHVSREISKFTLIVILLFILFALFHKIISRIYQFLVAFYSNNES
jgi:membrane protein DedA with SNARE-associated domain